MKFTKQRWHPDKSLVVGFVVTVVTCVLAYVVFSALLRGVTVRNEQKSHVPLAPDESPNAAK